MRRRSPNVNKHLSGFRLHSSEAPPFSGSFSVVQIIGGVSPKMSDSAALTSARLDTDCLKSSGGGEETSGEKRSSSLLIWRLPQSETRSFISRSDGGGGGEKRKKKTSLAVFSPLIPIFPESASCREVSEGSNGEDDERTGYCRRLAVEITDSCQGGVASPPPTYPCP